MRLLLALLFFPLIARCAEPDIRKVPWPKVIHEFPVGEDVTFQFDRYEVRHRIPEDPKIQEAGGSGGPIIELTLRDLKAHWSTTFTEQSVAERMLEPYRNKPQIEIWGRGGGGNWGRGLYRYISGKYRCVRIDDFASTPSRNNQKDKTAKLPKHFHGRAPQADDDTLYFVGTRIPDNE